MKTFSPVDQSNEVLYELLEEINELYESSEKTLIELELKPDDTELQNDLFRSVHTIKGDLGIVGFDPMIPLLQHVEDLLHYLRNDEIVYTSIMSDLVLLTMDKVIPFVEECIHHGETHYDDALFDQLITKIECITPTNSPKHEQLLINAVLLLDPSLATNIHYQAHVVEDVEKASEKALDFIGINSLDKEQQQDVIFFRQLMISVENRSEFWHGRSDRIAKLCLFLNKAAGSPIDESQLAVACYVYDFGMAFLPLSILHKSGKLNTAESNLMKSHIYKSAQLLENFDNWKSAKEIVLQHHERMDGSGYPWGIAPDEISEGAKLLAIVDSFDVLTHIRAYEGHIKRPKKRAVVELNKISSTLFCDKWMKIFNKTMISLLSR
jgi:HD-GYP domain-containing protein (c-di-GMP phosphodiesterase class II)